MNKSLFFHGTVKLDPVYLSLIFFLKELFCLDQKTLCTTARSNIRILAVPAVEKDVKNGKKKFTKVNGTYTKNIVYKEVITPHS